MERISRELSAGSGATVDRRSFLRSGAIALAGVLLSKPVNKAMANTDSAHQPAVVVGVVRKAPQAGLLVLGTATGEVTVQFTKQTDIKRFGDGTLGFIEGDEVVTEGEWHGDVFLATSLTSLFREVRGRVLRRTDKMIVTTGGTCEITAETLAAASQHGRAIDPEDVKVGQTIAVLGVRRPDGVIQASRVSAG